MSDLTAIDILINPDENTLERARAVNARLRQSVQRYLKQFKRRLQRPTCLY